MKPNNPIQIRLAEPWPSCPVTQLARQLGEIQPLNLGGGRVQENDTTLDQSLQGRRAPDPITSELGRRVTAPAEDYQLQAER